MSSQTIFLGGWGSRALDKHNVMVRRSLKIGKYNLVCGMGVQHFRLQHKIQIFGGEPSF